MKYIIFLFAILILGFSHQSAFSQVDRGGVPRSFQSHFTQKTPVKRIEVSAPDLLSIQREDNEAARLEKSYRVGVEIAVNISSATSGQWDDLPDGGRLWRVEVSCKGAQGIGLNYSRLQLPAGSDFFVYSPDHTTVIGAISSAEVPVLNSFATRPVHGDKVIIEYYEPENSSGKASIEISGIVFMYRGFELPETLISKSVASGNCEVNVNCDEGLNWQNQKQGVVKILTKVGSQYFYCSGTLLNNTTQDFSGLLLTASHCSEDFGGGISTSQDYNQWVFYFNYEYSGCTPSGAQELTVVGVQKLATSYTSSEIGSDFLLLKALNDIPPAYNPFYCGWDAGSGNSASGVCIHHPDGDVKKISTYTAPLGSGTWGSIPNTHWTVQWAPTVNGHGVTEGGSSGSPLFDDEGLVTGTLTGGESSCQNLTGEDMYGKVSFSWESNGVSFDQQLKPWLDPGNTGILKMPGSFNENKAIADFTANTIIIPVGGVIDFQDLSSGKPDTWHWYFQGGNPAESTVQNPVGIRFERFGTMNVKLVVSNAYNSDSVVKEKYIDVRAVVSPNPTTNGVVSILSDIRNTNDLLIDVFDSRGQIAQHFEYTGASASSYTLKLPDYGDIFIIRVIQGDQVQTHKILVVDCY